MGGDRTLYIAWRKHYPGDVRDVVVARSSDGGRTFAEPGDGVVHVAWYTGKESGPGLFRASSTDGGASFSAPLPVLVEGVSRRRWTGRFLPLAPDNLAVVEEVVDAGG